MMIIVGGLPPATRTNLCYSEILLRIYRVYIFMVFTARDNETVLVFTDTTNVRCGRQNNDGSSIMYMYNV